MTSAPLRIAVIGGGLGGLSAAVALYQAGFAVEVYEQAPELTQIGGGINMGLADGHAELVKLEDLWTLYWHLDWQPPAPRPP